MRKYFICGLFVCLFVCCGSSIYAWGWRCGGCYGGSCYTSPVPIQSKGIIDKKVVTTPVIPITSKKKCVQTKCDGCFCKEDCRTCPYTCETCPRKQLCNKCPVTIKEKSFIQPSKLKKVVKREMLEVEEHKVAESINKYRVAAGLKPLKVRYSEGPLARAHSRSMSECGALYHTSGYMECVAMAPGYDPVALWVNSPAHYSIMMMPHATEMIVARHAFWWTLRIW